MFPNLWGLRAGSCKTGSIKGGLFFACVSNQKLPQKDIKLRFNVMTLVG
jgi:hypothetical protein